jgi:GcrA cell cycle regulator
MSQTAKSSDVTAVLAVEAAAEPVKTDSWTALAGGKPVGIMELRNFMCRWPINAEADGAMRYCGSPSATEFGYCTAHRRIAHSPVRARAPIPARNYS